MAGSARLADSGSNVGRGHDGKLQQETVRGAVEERSRWWCFFWYEEKSACSDSAVEVGGKENKPVAVGLSRWVDFIPFMGLGTKHLFPGASRTLSPRGAVFLIQQCLWLSVWLSPPRGSSYAQHWPQAVRSTGGFSINSLTQLGLSLPRYLPAPRHHLQKK